PEVIVIAKSAARVAAHRTDLVGCQWLIAANNA
ncbi:MAG: hypothetical protein ACI9WU_004484, partial [Myxococcota bacterium]